MPSLDRLDQVSFCLPFRAIIQFTLVEIFCIECETGTVMSSGYRGGRQRRWEVSNIELGTVSLRSRYKQWRHRMPSGANNGRVFGAQPVGGHICH
jgi:hypothetical protein